MKLKDIIIHLRFPFSLFLLPIFLFGISLPSAAGICRLIYIGIALHLFLYPASNGFNSYYDKDTGPIGGILAPPPVDRRLLITSLIWELPGLLLLFIAGLQTGLLGLCYSLCSKAYSWNITRWKRYPVFSLAGIALVQGSLVVIMINPPLGNSFNVPLLITACATAAVFLIAVYPLTQVYQHEEDRRHGDKTYSMLVGIRGTFIHAAVCFILAGGGFISVFFLSGERRLFLLSVIFLVFLSPALLYFTGWMIKVWKNEEEADFLHTMRMNIISSSSLNIFFILKLIFGTAIN